MKPIKFESKQKVDQATLQNLGRDFLILEVVKTILKQIPIAAVKKLFNVKEINEVTCLENIKKATSSEECSYWESQLQQCIQNREEVFHLSFTVDMEENESQA